jgi:hypothetical protein
MARYLLEPVWWPPLLSMAGDITIVGHGSLIVRRLAMSTQLEFSLAQRFLGVLSSGRRVGRASIGLPLAQAHSTRWICSTMFAVLPTGHIAGNRIQPAPLGTGLRALFFRAAGMWFGNSAAIQHSSRPATCGPDNEYRGSGRRRSLFASLTTSDFWAQVQYRLRALVQSLLTQATKDFFIGLEAGQSGKFAAEGLGSQ